MICCIVGARIYQEEQLASRKTFIYHTITEYKAKLASHQA